MGIIPILGISRDVQLLSFQISHSSLVFLSAKKKKKKRKVNVLSKNDRLADFTRSKLFDRALLETTTFNPPFEIFDFGI